MSRVVIDEDGTLNIVATDMVTPVQKSTKDAKKGTNTYNSSPTQTTSAPSHITKDANKGNHDRDVEEFLAAPILHLVERPEGMD